MLLDRWQSALSFFIAGNEKGRQQYIQRPNRAHN
jgi:hypothetical protein